eukprot:SAG31_NODE_6895_length_1858_cov_1.828880_3_plen_102_part_01
MVSTAYVHRATARAHALKQQVRLMHLSCDDRARNPIPRVNDDNKGLADPSSCPGPSGTSGPGCIQFPAPCPQDRGREPWSTDGSGQGACSGDWTAGLIVDRV